MDKFTILASISFPPCEDGPAYGYIDNYEGPLMSIKEDIESDNGCGDSYTATFINKEDAIAWLSTRIKEKISVSITDYTDNNKTISVVGVDFATYKTIMERLNSKLRKH